MIEGDKRSRATTLHPKIGGKLDGIDLRENISDEVLEELHDHWMRFMVLVYPNQGISDEQHIAFGRKFGELEDHPSVAHRSSRNKEIYRVSNVDETGEIIPQETTSWQYLNLTWLWHTDSSFRQIPSLGSILHGLETTRSGGNTLFANLCESYDALSDSQKSEIQDLWVIHDHDYILSLSPELSKIPEKGDYTPMPQVRHPLVRIHPVTQRKSLFISPHTMVGIEGMSEKDGRGLLDELIEHATQEKFVYKHQWQNDDIVMWDNRCTMHCVEPYDNTTTRRIMHRVTTVGEEKPIPG